MVLAQAVERQHRVPTIRVLFRWALGFFLFLSNSGVSYIRPLCGGATLTDLPKKIGLAVQLEAKQA